MSINLGIPYIQYAVFLLIILFSVHLWKVGPNPKRVLLLSSSLLLLSIIMLPWLTQSEQVFI